jgi:hypothetical protein
VDRALLKISAVVGDYYHRGEWAEEALRKSLESIEHADLRLVSVSDLASEFEQKPDLIILFKEDRLNPTDEQIDLWMHHGVQDGIVRYVENGGSWLAWHSGFASYDPEGPYVQMLRGHFEHHPDKHQMVRYSAVSNSIGLECESGYEILDEHYFVKCDEEHTNVILRSSSVDGDSIAGWAHTYGDGKVCCFAPAHNYEGLQHPGVVNSLSRIIEWCAGK